MLAVLRARLTHQSFSRSRACCLNRNLLIGASRRPLSIQADAQHDLAAQALQASAVYSQISTSAQPKHDSAPRDHIVQPQQPESPPQASYRISPSELSNAKAHQKPWSWKMFRHVETNKQPWRHYCNTKEKAERTAKLFLEDGYTHLGFDLEWSPAGKNYNDAGLNAKGNCSMLQLANEKRIAIFHLALHAETTPATIFPPTLAHIMSSPHFTKLGVHISADCTRLQRYYNVSSHSYFELSHLYKSVFLAATPELIDRRSVAMSAIVRDVFGLEIAKEQNIRGSDWSKKVDVEQTDYAASDAYAGLMLFHELDRMRREAVPEVEMPWFAEFKRKLGPGKARKAAVAEPEAGKTEIEEEEEADGEEEAVDVEAEELQALPIKTEEQRASPTKTRTTTKDEKTPAEKAAALERRRKWLQTNFFRR